MGKKLDRRFILSDNSVNRYGFRVLTEGLNLPVFRKNPVMLWMHMRDEGTKSWCDYRPIGHWEDIEVNDKGELSACPYFDLADDLSKEICLKVEEGTISATSIGLIPMTFSDDPKHLLPGQKRATVLKADLMEASFCDIPANANAVRLYEQPTGLAMTPTTVDVPLLNTATPMKFRSTMQALLSFLGIAAEKADETELTVEQLASINDEMRSLRETLAERDTEIATLRTSHETALQEKDTEIRNLRTENAALLDQVQNLKKSPVETPAVSPEKEPLSAESSPLDRLNEFAQTDCDFLSIVSKGQELGVFK